MVGIIKFESGVRIVLADALFKDSERIELIAEKAWIAQKYFEYVNRGKVGKSKVVHPIDLEVRRFRTQDGHKPSGRDVFNTGNNLVLDTDVYLGRRQFLAGYSADLKLLGYIEVVATEG